LIVSSLNIFHIQRYKKGSDNLKTHILRCFNDAFPLIDSSQMNQSVNSYILICYEACTQNDFSLQPLGRILFKFERLGIPPILIVAQVSQKFIALIFKTHKNTQTDGVVLKVVNFCTGSLVILMTLFPPTSLELVKKKLPNSPVLLILNQFVHLFLSLNFQSQS
jgi:hypothetical protein